MNHDVIVMILGLSALGMLSQLPFAQAKKTTKRKRLPTPKSAAAKQSSRDASLRQDASATKAAAAKKHAAAARKYAAEAKKAAAQAEKEAVLAIRAAASAHLEAEKAVASTKPVVKAAAGKAARSRKKPLNRSRDLPKSSDGGHRGLDTTAGGGISGAGRGFSITSDDFDEDDGGFGGAG